MDDVASGSAAYIQAERIIRIESPLGADVLLPERCEVREGVNSLFEISISVRSTKTDIQPADIVGKLVDVSLELDGAGKRRPWNGLVTEMHEGPAVTRGLRSYALTIRPQLWLMSQKSDRRIWLDKSAIDVLQTLMQEHGFPSAQVITVDAVPPQHYSVQWNETDLDYLRRRLEEDGLFFWHVHEKGKHTLYVSNAPNGYRNGEDTDVRLSLGSSDRNHLNQWRKRYLYTPGKRAASDWNFETPSDAQRGDTPSKVKLPKNGSYELYERASPTATRRSGRQNCACRRLRSITNASRARRWCARLRPASASSLMKSRIRIMSMSRILFLTYAM
jgi:type VI secretion system secreted protein VgrG